jgi:hypothetical protein
LKFREKPTRTDDMTRILRGVGSRILPCGCLVGFYETYNTQTVAILDVRAPACSEATHQTGKSIDVKPGDGEVGSENLELRT